jgi:glyceraldehyde-3-phosphate dehydrogenase (ferredoxin)
MENNLKVLFVDAGTSFYRINHYLLGSFFGPVDLGLHLSGKHNSLNIGAGILAGSIFPGSNRLMFTGFSPCWGGFFISSMGGAGLVFDNLGINMLSIVGKAATPSVLYLNRKHGEEIQVEIKSLDIQKVWNEGREGVYSLMDYTLNRYGENYSNDPRILATGPASQATDFGAICSVPIRKGELTFVDTWAGRGGFGTKLFKEHGIAAVIYGGTFIDEDFRDRKVADQWFVDKYQMKLTAKDLEVTTKYRKSMINLLSITTSNNSTKKPLNPKSRKIVVNHVLRSAKKRTVNSKKITSLIKQWGLCQGFLTNVLPKN